MASFVQFTEVTSEAPVAVNPDHVAVASPAPEDHGGTTLLLLRDGQDLRVKGAYPEVVRKLGVPRAPMPVSSATARAGASQAAKSQTPRGSENGSGPLVGAGPGSSV
jgi:hypothetical protein